MTTIPGASDFAFMEPASDKTPWLLLEQYAHVPQKGRSLFQGSLAQQNAKYREFQNFVRQARAYWDAATHVIGSASGLLYYYCFLNLAKAELLRQEPCPVMPVKEKRIKHGLSHDPRGTDSIRGDYLTIQPGVFDELMKARTGVSIPHGTRLPILNLLSMIPEITWEISEFGPTRPLARYAYQSIASDVSRSWVLLGVPDGRLDAREPLAILLSRNFDEIRLDNWRTIFALSTRTTPASMKVFQSKGTFGRTESQAAKNFTRTALGSFASDPIGTNCDLILTHSLRKSQPLAIPLDLARYAAMFYISSLVRYKPSTLDPTRNGLQAWLMDSAAREMPVNLLVGAIGGIANVSVSFEPSVYRI